RPTGEWHECSDSTARTDMVGGVRSAAYARIETGGDAVHQRRRIVAILARHHPHARRIVGAPTPSLHAHVAEAEQRHRAVAFAVDHAVRDPLRRIAYGGVDEERHRVGGA